MSANVSKNMIAGVLEAKTANLLILNGLEAIVANIMEILFATDLDMFCKWFAGIFYLAVHRRMLFNSYIIHACFTIVFRNVLNATKI